jgi:hypothetical protein
MVKKTCQRLDLFAISGYIVGTTWSRSVATKSQPKAETAFDIFGSDLPDEVFEGVFDQRCESNWREIDFPFSECCRPHS